MFSISQRDNFFVAGFSAMASPCEVLMDTRDESLARQLAAVVEAEALRIEQKFSRYRDDNLVFQINNSHGQGITVDDEFCRLLDFADQCYRLSDGLFDISSGVLRKLWHFDGSDKLPSAKQVRSLLPFIGWHKISWQKPTIRLPEGMEIDLGGIGKEYAVDSAALKVSKLSDIPMLINFGGDLFANKAPIGKTQWSIGIEDIGGSDSKAFVYLKQGALATSGDARRFLEKNGVRYSHVLNPKTGWPVRKAPHSVTVAANTCIEAGFFSTMAMLKGKDARDFLEAQEVLYWIQG